MYCPEDGRPIPVGEMDSAAYISGGVYPPCPTCHTRWRYDGENGRYEVVAYPEDSNTMNAPVSDLFEKILKATGANRRALGVDALVANIVDTMEKEALADGQCTYYKGTFAVARETLATAGLTCEKDPGYHGLPPEGRLRWISFFGDDWEYLTRREAIEVLLAERS